MKRIASSVLGSLLLLPACGSEAKEVPAAPPPQPAAKPAAEPAAKPAAEPAAPAEPTKPPSQEAATPESTDVDSAYQLLMAKPEQQVDSIEIQHILIAFQGVPRVRGVTRTKEEAKALAQKVFTEAVGGADYDALVKEYTNDSAPGIYPLTQASRKGMVRSFGDVGFRLKVGEIGIAVYDPVASEYGWHIIKRLK